MAKYKVLSAIGVLLLFIAMLCVCSCVWFASSGTTPLHNTAVVFFAMFAFVSFLIGIGMVVMNWGNKP